MLVFTYANTAMCDDVTYHWQALSAPYSQDTHQFSFALTDCWQCKEESGMKNGVKLYISEDMLGGPLDYTTRIARSRGSDLQCSTTHGDLVLFLDIDLLMSYFPREHTVRSVVPNCTSSDRRASEEFSDYIETYCRGEPSSHTYSVLADFVAEFLPNRLDNETQKATTKIHVS